MNGGYKKIDFSPRYSKMKQHILLKVTVYDCMVGVMLGTMELII